MEAGELFLSTVTSKLKLHMPSIVLCNRHVHIYSNDIINASRSLGFKDKLGQSSHLLNLTWSILNNWCIAEEQCKSSLILMVNAQRF